jgi:hypothetical protein
VRAVPELAVAAPPVLIWPELRWLVVAPPPLVAPPLVAPPPVVAAPPVAPPPVPDDVSQGMFIVLPSGMCIGQVPEP